MELLRENLEGQKKNFFTGKSCLPILEMKKRKGRRWISNLQLLQFSMEGVGAVLLMGYIFYDSFYIGFLFLPLAAVYLSIRIKNCIRRKKQQLLLQFKDGMLAVAVAMRVGYSVENAFTEAAKELRTIYGEKTEIVKIFVGFVYQLEMNRNIEELISEFAKEIQIEDIMSFSEIFRYAKRSGGDLVAIIQDTVSAIGEKAEVSREIEILISAKQMEQMIMDVVPIGIILYLRITSPEMMGRLYGNFTGAFVMTVCLCMYTAAVGIAMYITDIQV